MRREQGFSLVEMCVTLGALGLVVTLSMSALNQVLPQWRLRQAANDIAFSLRGARAKAVLERTTVIMPFDTDRGLYTIAADLAPGNVTLEQHGTQQVRLAELPNGISFARPDHNPHAIWLEPPGMGGEDAASFTSAGVLQSVHIPGYVFLGAPSHNLYRRVEVTLGGTIRIQKWTGTAWE